MLEEADCDVLILLDCCAAASSAGGSSNTITELIAACGFESYAPGVGEHSFTRSLIEELKYYGQRPDLISTAFLHNKVLARTKKSWNPRYAVDGTHERRRTPIHVHLADKSMQRCINLSPLPPVLTHQVPPLPELPGTTPSSSTEESTKESDNSGIDSTSQSSLSEVWPDPQHDSPKVLISIALEEGQPLSAAEWFDWLLSFPAKAKCIHLESIYKSDSTLMLLSLPVAVWDMLPRDPAISFISFVKSQNLLFPKNRPKGLAIALKRILDREIRISRKMARHRDIESTRTSFPKTESAPSTTGWELGEIRHAIDSLSQPSTARTHIPTEADFSPPIDLLGLSHVHQPEHGDDNHWTHTLVSSEPENFKSGQSIQNSSPSKPIVPESSEHPHNRREPPSEPNKSSRLGKFLPQRWKRES